MAEKKFQDLNLSNAFLFAAALSDPEACRMVLEMILGEKSPNITVQAEHNLLYNSDFRSIRLDVYAMEKMLIDIPLRIVVWNMTYPLAMKRVRLY